MKSRDAIGRRGILSGALAVVGSGGCGVFACSGSSNAPSAPAKAVAIDGDDARIDLVLVPDLRLVGKSVNVQGQDGMEPVVVAHVREGEYIAASMRCTHEGADIEYDKAKSRLKCASGGATFSLEGKHLSGAGGGALETYPVELVADELIVRGVARG